MNIAELRRELKTKESKLAGLRRERSKLQTRLERLDSRIASLGGEKSSSAGSEKGNGRRRATNNKPLLDYAQAALKSGKNLRIPEVMEGVQELGYSSYSKDFYSIVAATLRGPQFERVSRGVYRLAKKKLRSSKK